MHCKKDYLDRLTGSKSLGTPAKLADIGASKAANTNNSTMEIPIHISFFNPSSKRYSPDQSRAPCLLTLQAVQHIF